RVIAPHIGGKPEVRVVGHTHNVRLILPRDRHEHRAEDLLAREPPFVPHVREDSGLDVIPLGERSLLWWEAADHGAHTLLTRALIDEATHALELLFADDRAHIAGLIEWITHLELRELRREPVEERIEDVLV